MSNYSYGQGQKDANNNQSARNVQNEHWKVKQDYNAGYAAAQKQKS